MASIPISPTLNSVTSELNPTKSSKLTQTHLIKLKENGEKHQNFSKSCFKNISCLCKDGQLQKAVDFLTQMEWKNLHIGPEIYGELLQGCVYERDLLLGQQIHAKIIKNGDFYAKNEYIETKLLIFYAKCDLFDVSNHMFCRLRNQNVFSWAAIFGMYCRMGLSEEALWGFIEMQENGFNGDNFIIPNVLKACGALKNVGFGKCVHGYVIKLGFETCVFVASSLVDMYGKFGALGDARMVFNNMIERNVVAWNTMMVSYVQNGLNREAIEVFHDMRIEGVEPTRVTMSSFLSASANICAIEEGKQGHALAIVNGLDLDNILGSSVINFYAKVGLVEDAELVFTRMIEKDVVTWNLLISCYVQNGLIKNALNLCHKIRSEGFRFDSVTLSSILSASADMRDLKLGKEAHCYCIRNDLVSDVVVASSIVDMYAKCERIADARQVFDSIREKDLVLWNTLLAAYAELGLSGETLKLFYQMQLESIPPNVRSWNSAILGFVRAGQVNEATDMLSQMQALHIQPNLRTYTTLITGLTQYEFSNEAIMLFQQMLQSGLQPNAVSLVCALSACTIGELIRYGTAIHGYILRQNIPLSVSVPTSLINMYAKCGMLKQARSIFDITLTKELALYNAMISGYSIHGCAAEALALYRHLQRGRLEPDSITFTSVLSSCSHGGLVNEALEIFGDMVSVYNVKPCIEHFGCLVTLLSRHGDLHEAVRLIQRMPFEPDAQMLGSLLAACRELNETELGDCIAEHLFRMEPINVGNYVAVSNMFASAGRWDDASKLRDLIKAKGLRKSPGGSWIQVGEEVHVFVAGDRSHLQTEEIYTILTLLGMEMQLDGYNSTVMHAHLIP